MYQTGYLGDFILNQLENEIPEEMQQKRVGQ